MKYALFLFILAGALRTLASAAVPLGTVRSVGSAHHTTDDGIQSWNSVSLVSPSGARYADETYDGPDRPDGSTSVPVVLDQPGVWQLWLNSGYSAPQAGSSEQRVVEYLDVQPAAPANAAPTVAWSSAPAAVAAGQGYAVSAEGRDADGNLMQVHVWKDGMPFAFGGGGDGYAAGAGNAVSDPGPRTVVFTAQATDAAGAVSEMIVHMVAVAAPEAVNRAPEIAWSSGPAAADDSETYVVSAEGRDPDGNLAQVNIWKDGVPFAFGGGGDGSSAGTGNATADAGPRTVVFTAQAVDGAGAVSAMLSRTVLIRARVAVNRAPVIRWQNMVGTVAAFEAYAVAAVAEDPDGNLAQVQIWKDGSPFAAGSEAGSAGGWATDGGPRTVTYTAQAADTDGAVSELIVQSVAVAGPGNVAPSVVWTVAPMSAESGRSYTVAVRGADADGNLATVTLLKQGVVVAAGNSDAAVETADAGPATFVFTAFATDAMGARSETITHTVAISGTAAGFTLVTEAGPGGTVSPGGVYPAGSAVVVTAVAAVGYEFEAWKGDAAGGSNAVTVTMDRNRTVRAQFVQRSYTLVTGTAGGGTVTPGGTYAHGSVVTVAADPAPTFRFAGWSGDAAGGAPAVAVVMDGPKTVHAQFEGKTAQTILFPEPAVNSSGTPWTLGATASSGLPVTYLVVGGDGTVAGGQLQLSGSGPVTVEARQDGNAFYLPAAPVARTINTRASAVIRYQAASRTVLHAESVRGIAPFVLENR